MSVVESLFAKRLTSAILILLLLLVAAFPATGRLRFLEAHLILEKVLLLRVILGSAAASL